MAVLVAGHFFEPGESVLVWTADTPQQTAPAVYIRSAPRRDVERTARNVLPGSQQTLHLVRYSAARGRLEHEEWIEGARLLKDADASRRAMRNRTAAVAAAAPAPGARPTSVATARPAAAATAAASTAAAAATSSSVPVPRAAPVPAPAPAPAATAAAATTSAATAPLPSHAPPRAGARAFDADALAPYAAREATAAARPEAFTLHPSSALCAKLVEDRENIVGRRCLLRLANPLAGAGSRHAFGTTAAHVLHGFQAHMLRQDARFWAPARAAILADLWSAFEFALGPRLLYRFERLQYAERRAFAEANRLALADIYRPEHLLRLVVRLPLWLAEARPPPPETAAPEETRSILQHLLDYMALRPDIWSSYFLADGDYVQRASE